MLKTDILNNFQILYSNLDRFCQMQLNFYNIFLKGFKWRF